MQMDDAVVFSKKTAQEHYAEQEKGARLTAEDRDAIRAGHDQHYDALHMIEEELDARGIAYETVSLPYEDPDEADLYVVAGGDGTMLDAHPYIADTPVLGINTDEERSDGGLHEFGVAECADALDDVLDGSAVIDEWIRIAVEVGDEQDIALNEVLVGPDHLGNTAEYRVEHRGSRDVDESHRNTGMIVSTPAGITGWYRNIYRERYDDTVDPEQSHLYYITFQNMDDIDADRGVIAPGDTFTVTSEMNYDGALKCDGTRRTHAFPRGTTAELEQGEPLRVVANTD